jgi:tRNA modification GTPase
LISERAILEPRRATFTVIRQPNTPSQALVAVTEDSRSDPLDQAVVTFFPGPASYTGEDVVELSAHGSPVVLRAIVAAAVKGGARLAAPGEFTLRAYLNGRVDLTQAEAVADLIEAVTPLQARAAFDQLQGTLTRRIADIGTTLFDLMARLEASVDFPDEGYHFITPAEVVVEIDSVATHVGNLLGAARRGRLVREGLQIAIVGAPNVGKSSLFNALVGASRAIVADVPGTTRDLISEVVDLKGLRVTLVDTAGLREGRDAIEAEGVSRSHQAAGVADLVLFVVDPDSPPGADGVEVGIRAAGQRRLIVENKSDLNKRSNSKVDIRVSALTGAGLDSLCDRIFEALDVDLASDRPEITNVRHIALLEDVERALVRARAAAWSDGHSLSEEFVLADLQSAQLALEEITGRRTPDDVLEHIFSRFCVGK